MNNVLITGASRGLGMEMTWQLLQEEEGPLVIATCRHPEKAEALQRMKSQHKDRLKVFSMDVADPDSVSAARDAIASQVDHLDWLVNNAGVGGFEEIYETDPEEMTKAFRINAVGPLLVTRAYAPLLEAAEAGMVFLMSSRMGSIGHVGKSNRQTFPYPASKAALNMVGVQLAKALKDKKIGVILQTPGWVKTDMGGDEATFTPTQSISKVLKVWKSLSFSDSGKFLDENGDEVPW